MQVIAAHTIPEDVQAGKFAYVINSVTFQTTGGNIYPVVNFSVVDPTHSNAPYNILTAAPFAGTHRVLAYPCAPTTRRVSPSTSRGTRVTTPTGAAARRPRNGATHFLEPALRMRNRDASPRTDRPRRLGRVYNDVDDSAAGGAGGQLPTRGRYGLPRDCKRRRGHRRSSRGRHHWPRRRLHSRHQRRRLWKRRRGPRSRGARSSTSPSAMSAITCSHCTAATETTTSRFASPVTIRRRPM